MKNAINYFKVTGQIVKAGSDHFGHHIQISTLSRGQKAFPEIYIPDDFSFELGDWVCCSGICEQKGQKRETRYSAQKISAAPRGQYENMFQIEGTVLFSEFTRFGCTLALRTSRGTLNLGCGIQKVSRRIRKIEKKSVVQLQGLCGPVEGKSVMKPLHRQMLVTGCQLIEAAPPAVKTKAAAEKPAPAFAGAKTGTAAQPAAKKEKKPAASFQGKTVQAQAKAYQTVRKVQKASEPAAIPVSETAAPSAAAPASSLKNAADSRKTRQKVKTGQPAYAAMPSASGYSKAYDDTFLLDSSSLEQVHAVKLSAPCVPASSVCEKTIRQVQEQAKKSQAAAKAGSKQTQKLIENTQTRIDAFRFGGANPNLVPKTAPVRPAARTAVSFDRLNQAVAENPSDCLNGSAFPDDCLDFSADYDPFSFADALVIPEEEEDTFNLF